MNCSKDADYIKACGDRVTGIVRDVSGGDRFAESFNVRACAKHCLELSDLRLLPQGAAWGHFYDELWKMLPIIR